MKRQTASRIIVIAILAFVLGKMMASASFNYLYHGLDDFATVSKLTEEKESLKTSLLRAKASYEIDLLKKQITDVDSRTLQTLDGMEAKRVKADILGILVGAGAAGAIMAFGWKTKGHPL